MALAAAIKRLSNDGVSARESRQRLRCSELGIAENGLVETSPPRSRDGRNLLHFRYTTRNGSVTGILLVKVFQRQATATFAATRYLFGMPECMMPFSHIAQRVVRHKQVASRHILDVPAERIIAQSRFVLCLITLLVAHLQPVKPAQYATAATLILTAYTIFAAGLVALTYHRFVAPTTQRLIHFADIAIICVLLFLTEGATSPSLVLFIFALLAAVFRRWSWQVVLATAIAFGLAFLVANIIWGAIANAEGVERDLTTISIVRSSCLVVIGALLAYVSASREGSRARIERLIQPLGKKNLQDVLAHAALVAKARGILVVWEEAEEPYVYWGYWRDDRYREGRESPGTFGDVVDPSLSNSAFLMDCASSKFLLSSAGPKRITSPAIHTDLVAKFAIGKVVTAAFSGTTCAGRVFVLDCGGESDDHLILTNFMACRIGMRLDRLALQRQAEVAIATREKMRLTQDLHDGVLQSLTAAALQLDLVGKSRDTVSRLAVVKQLVAKEQRRIRKFVDQTYVKSIPSLDVVDTNDLQQVVEDAGRYWNCTTSFSVAPKSATIAQALANQLSFMLAEAVANAVRHGGASRVDVAIERANEYFCIKVRDNGRGYGYPVRHEHEKPASIRKRVSSLGGSLSVETFSNGTELAIQVPLS
jgi:signal transduction histidine kinase